MLGQYALTLERGFRQLFRLDRDHTSQARVNLILVNAASWILWIGFILGRG